MVVLLNFFENVYFGEKTAEEQKSMKFLKNIFWLQHDMTIQLYYMGKVISLSCAYTCICIHRSCWFEILGLVLTKTCLRGLMPKRDSNHFTPLQRLARN